MNQITKLKTAAMLAPFALVGAAGAQTTAGAIDLSGAQTNVVAIVGVGVAITTALTIYGLGKRAANRA